MEWTGWLHRAAYHVTPHSEPQMCYFSMLIVSDTD